MQSLTAYKWYSYLTKHSFDLVYLIIILYHIFCVTAISIVKNDKKLDILQQMCYHINMDSDIMLLKTGLKGIRTKKTADYEYHMNKCGLIGIFNQM